MAGNLRRRSFGPDARGGGTVVSGTDGTATADPVRLTVHHECCLENAPPPLLAALRAELTIDNPRYQDAERFGR